MNSIAPGAVPVPKDPPPPEESALHEAWANLTPVARRRARPLHRKGPQHSRPSISHCITSVRHSTIITALRPEGAERLAMGAAEGRLARRRLLSGLPWGV